MRDARKRPLLTERDQYSQTEGCHQADITGAIVRDPVFESFTSGTQPRHTTPRISRGMHTVIFTRLIDRVKPPTENATQTLILVHRRELVEQAARHCTNAYPTKSIDIEMGTSHASGSADITVASVKSLNSGDRMMKFDPDKYKLILVDEAHHIVAQSYMDALRHFRVVEGDPWLYKPALVGVSATLSRFDGLRLSDAIDHIVYHKDYVDMIKEKWLSDVIFTTVQSKANISSIRKAANGDFQIGDLSRAVNTAQTNEITVRAWLSRCSDRKSTLVFCVDIAHLNALTSEFRSHGVDARSITGETASVTRSQRLDAFRNGEYPVLLNCGVFTEGTDIPNIDCVLLARPTRSRNLLVQMIGRGMRLHSGKANCHIIDMVASLEAGIITTPTLFGLDPASLVKEANVDDMKQLHEEAMLQPLNTPGSKSSVAAASADVSRTVTFKHYDSVWDLIDDTSSERHIRGMSPFAWVQVDGDRYILSSNDGNYITIEKTANEETQFQVLYVRKLPPSAFLESRPDRPSRSPYARPKQIGTANTLSDAVRAADTFAQEHFVYQIVSNSAKWRSRPASEGQLSFLNDFRPQDDKLTPETLTKGKAGDMITKIKHGARGRFKKHGQQQRAVQKDVTKNEADARLRMREHVRVGPMRHSERSWDSHTTEEKQKAVILNSIRASPDVKRSRKFLRTPEGEMSGAHHATWLAKHEDDFSSWDDSSSWS